MTHEEFLIHADGAIACFHGIEPIILKYSATTHRTVWFSNWADEDKRSFDDKSRMATVSIGVLDSVITRHVRRSVTTSQGPSDLFLEALKANSNEGIPYIRDAVASLRFLKAKLEPLIAAAPDTPVEELGADQKPSAPHEDTGANEDHMSWADFNDCIGQAKRAFEGMRQLLANVDPGTDLPRSRTEDWRQLDKLRSTAATMVGHLDATVRDVSSGRETDGPDTSELLRKAARVTGSWGLGTLDSAISELDFLWAKFPSERVWLKDQAAAAHVKQVTPRGGQARSELASEFERTRVAIRDGFGHDWYFSDIDNDLREIALCMDAECYRAALSLAGRTLELVLKLYCKNNNITFDDNWMVGKLFDALNTSSLYVDPGLKNIWNLINQQRIVGVHHKPSVPIPSRDQAKLVCHALLDALKRVFRLAD